MAKPNKQGEPIVLTLTIPTDGSGVADVVGKKGDLGIVRQVTYGDQNDLAAAIYEAAWELVEMEQNPPPLFDAPKPVPKAKKAAAAEASVEAEAAPEGNPPAEDEAVDEEPGDEASDDSLDEEPEAEQETAEESGGG